MKNYNSLLYRLINGALTTDEKEEYTKVLDLTVRLDDQISRSSTGIAKQIREMESVAAKVPAAAAAILPEIAKLRELAASTNVSVAFDAADAMQEAYQIVGNETAASILVRGLAKHISSNVGYYAFMQYVDKKTHVVRPGSPIKQDVVDEYFRLYGKKVDDDDAEAIAN